MIRSLLMRLHRVTAFAFSALVFVTPAAAWNFVTHRVIAGIAYDQLQPATRLNVDALIRLHPDYETLFVKNAPAEGPARARAAFIEAAVWGDQIRGDPRFYDDAAKDAMPTPVLPGFPDMKRHSAWHFVDLPFSQDGTPLDPAAAPNLVTEIERMMADVVRPGISQSQKAYEIVWLLHLIGDVHAPLHCVARDSAEHPMGDQGGNFVFVVGQASTETVTLHKYWDDAVGPSSSPTVWVASTIQLIEHAHPISRGQTAARDSGPSGWAQESLSLSQTEIYTFGTNNGSKEQPIHFSPEYQANSRKVGERQVVTAAERLADFLNRSIQ